MPWKLAQKMLIISLILSVKLTQGEKYYCNLDQEMYKNEP